jgi:hypothetical protein
MTELNAVLLRVNDVNLQKGFVEVHRFYLAAQRKMKALKFALPSPKELRSPDY